MLLSNCAIMAKKSNFNKKSRNQEIHNFNNIPSD